MVGCLYETDKRAWRLKPRLLVLHTLPLAAVGIPAGDRDRALRRAVKALSGVGARRCLTPPGFEDWAALTALGLSPVDPLPLCRTMAAELVLFCLNDVPLRRRRVALRGHDALAACSLAQALCPQVGAILLDFDRGEEALGKLLRETYGAAPLHLSRDRPPQLSVELSPMPPLGCRTLRLWGPPDLAGLDLTADFPLPPEVEPLPFLALLWETGRLKREEIHPAYALDRPEEKPYNIQHC